MLGALYRFAYHYGDRVGVLGPHERGELFAVAAVLPTIVVNLGQPAAGRVYATDSSMLGYAVHSTLVDKNEVEALCAVRERSRFRPARPGPPVHLSVQSADAVAEP